MGRKKMRRIQDEVDDDIASLPDDDIGLEELDELPPRKVHFRSRHNHNDFNNHRQYPFRSRRNKNQAQEQREGRRLRRNSSRIQDNLRSSQSRRDEKTRSLGVLKTNEENGKAGDEEEDEDDSDFEQEIKDDEKGRHQSTNESELSSDEDEDETEEDGSQLEGSHSRYAFRHNRPQFPSKKRERPMRSCRARARSVSFVSSGVRKKYRKNNLNSIEIQRLPANPALDARAHGHGRGHKSRRRRLDHCSSSSNSSSTSSSSSDDDGNTRHSLRNDMKQEAKFERRQFKSLLKGRQELMPINLTDREVRTNLTQLARDKVRHATSKSSCADIDPMIIESGTGFDQVGGLSQHIQSLKEIILFPMLYPHLFDRFNIQTPKGVLFYGPPGTGKTLLARALAQECSRDGRNKVAFFMRKGADCLSKWVGESERQLRLLFDQAFRMRPSIIFFDEIDGLAPVRSSRQDQIHSSIVSTLLALMDGLDSRGAVIVIGATNRLDSIDPALRRPGRFDRELCFSLPDLKARRDILGIHTKLWDESCPDSTLLNWLAERTSGYCGADLKALCTEAVLIAIRERFPHIYLRSEKLELDPTKIKIVQQHFSDALRLIRPALKRDNCSLQPQHNDESARIHFIEPFVRELLSSHIPNGFLHRQNAENLYEDELERVVMALKVQPKVPSARLLLYGSGKLGQTTHFLPALVHKLECLPVFCLSTIQIFAGPTTPDEYISQTIRKVMSMSGQEGTVPAIILLPDLDLLETILPHGTWSMLISSLNSFTGLTSLLLLASVQRQYIDCSDDIKQIFRSPKSICEVHRPTRKSIRAYFNAILERARVQPFQFDPNNYPPPAKAATTSTPIRKFTEAECKELEGIYQQTLRQFRIFLRDLLRQLLREQRFKNFHMPVDKEDAEDYYEIIEQPMCLSQMMYNIDAGKYTSKDAFMNDIRLIRDNAIEYNPDTDMDSKQIRHSANALIDMAEALFSIEMADDFPEKLEETRKLAEEARNSLNTEENSGKHPENGTDQQVEAVPVPPKDPTNQSSVKRLKRGVEEKLHGEKALELAINEEDCGFVKKKQRKTEQSPPPILILNLDELRAVAEKATDKVRICGWGVPDIECLGAELIQLIEQFKDLWDRSTLPMKLMDCVEEFQI